jgi:two-component system phosphate regulon sensor histidine kinase PhoR
VSLTSRLVWGTITVVAFTLLLMLWGAERWSMTAAALFALVVALGLATLTGRAVAQPLVALSKAARDIASGLLPAFPRSGIPEVDALVQALRQMNRQLADRFEDVQREKAEAAAIVNAMVEGVIATDPRGRIVTANPAARRLLGYSHEADLPDLRTLFRVKAARAAVDAVLEGEAVQDREVEFDGVTLTLNARALPTGGAVLVLHDLTEVRRLEAVRRDFVANVSHELKTPLTSISGYAETLADGGVDPATTKRSRRLSTARREMRRLGMISSTCRASRPGAGSRNRWQCPSRARRTNAGRCSPTGRPRDA